MYPDPSTAQIAIADGAAGAAKALKSARKGSAKRDLAYDTVFGNINGLQSTAGVRVNEDKALQLVAIYACVSYIADYVASLPKFVYERLAKGKNRAINHWLYPIAHDNPNPFMNDYEFVETLTGHVLLWGNAYAEIQRNEAGEVIALWPLRPDKMRIQVYRGELYYYYMPPINYPGATGGQPVEQQLRRDQVFHLRGLGGDGLMGYSPIQLHREAIALAFAEQEYRSRFFANDAHPGGVLQKDGRLSEPAYNRLKSQWHEAHSGLSNAHRVAILEEGLKWNQIGIPAKDMEFIEGRKYQKTEIATIYRVKPYKIGILEPGTVSFASVEQQAIDTHIDTMRPWVLRWEKKFNSLLGQRRKYFVEFLFDAVLRADSESRARTLQIWRMNGLINADDWLDLENRNPLPDDKGTDYWQPANMMVVGAEPPPEPPAAGLNGSARPTIPAMGSNGAAHDTNGSR